MNRPQSTDVGTSVKLTAAVTNAIYLGGDKNSHYFTGLMKEFVFARKNLTDYVLNRQYRPEM